MRLPTMGLPTIVEFQSGAGHSEREQRDLELGVEDSHWSRRNCVIPIHIASLPRSLCVESLECVE